MSKLKTKLNVHNPKKRSTFTEQRAGLHKDESLEAERYYFSDKKEISPYRAPKVLPALLSSSVRSTFDARPVNAVDTFGSQQKIIAPNQIIDPANSPLTFEYSVEVPQGRTYVLREFFFVPTRLLYDEFNNPIPDLFNINFFINNSPVSENANLKFGADGTGGYVDAFFIIEEEQTLKMVATTTDPAFLDLGLPFDVSMSAEMNMRFNSLLDDSRETPYQIGNVIDLTGKTETLQLGSVNSDTNTRKYKRPGS